MRILSARILRFPRWGEVEIIERGYLAWEGGRIRDLGAGPPPLTGEREDLGNWLILPGFVDLHTHYPQLEVRGRYGATLLEWLKRYVFPEEATFSDPRKAERVARQFFSELFRAGVTTAVLFSTVHEEATDIAFRVAQEMGARAVIGKVMMDREAPEALLENPEISLERSLHLFRRWNGVEERLYYAFTPRFAISCSDRLLRMAGEAAAEHGAFVQTHLAETEEEVRQVQTLFPGVPTYTEVYERAGLLGPRTIVAHAIHLSERERALLAQRQVRIAHCPASNFFLRSGRMDLWALKRYGLIVGLGSDVGAGPYFSPFAHMRDACYTNPLSPAEAFYMATRAGAEALGWEDRIGDLLPGMEADFIVVDPSRLIRPDAPVEEILPQLIFRGDEREIRRTVIRGREVYRSP